MISVTNGAALFYFKEENSMKNVVVGIFAVIIAIAMCCFVFGSCGSSSSSSGKKWSELTEQEKDNARWSYHAKQAAEDYRNSH